MHVCVYIINMHLYIMRIYACVHACIDIIIIIIIVIIAIIIMITVHAEV